MVIRVAIERLRATASVSLFALAAVGAAAAAGSIARSRIYGGEPFASNPTLLFCPDPLPRMVEVSAAEGARRWLKP